MGLLFTEKRESEVRTADRICFICGNDRSIQKGAMGAYSLMECSECGLQYINPIPDKKRLDEIYLDYYKVWGIEHFEEEISRIKKKTFIGYLENIIDYAPRGRLLDIGCATGEFMTVAQEKGFDVYGVEVSPYGIKKCRELFGEEKIVPHNLQEKIFPFNFFDVITLSDVIEHIYEPASFLDIVWSILKPHGVLVIVTPDASSWTRSFLGMRWPHYKEEHVYYFNRYNICKFLSSHFDILVSNPAYKFLTVNYCANVIGSYSNYSLIKRIVLILKPLFALMKLFPFRVNIGEIFILCRKKQSSDARKDVSDG